MGKNKRIGISLAAGFAIAIIAGFLFAILLKNPCGVWPLSPQDQYQSTNGLYPDSLVAACAANGGYPFFIGGRGSSMEATGRLMNFSGFLVLGNIGFNPNWLFLIWILNWLFWSVLVWLIVRLVKK